MTNQLTNQLAEVTPDNAPTVFVQGGLTQYLDAVRAEVASEVPDLSTKKGRDRIASLAAKVSRSKTAIEKPGRDYLRRLKELPKTVEAELREFVKSMDALRDEVRAPLNAWEQAEASRKAEHEAAIAEMRQQVLDAHEATSEHLAACIAGVEAVQLGDHWEEYAAEAGAAKDEVLTALRGHLVAAQQREAEAAELERLRQEAAAREQKEREEAIARDAAERAKREAEQAAQAAQEQAAKALEDAKRAQEQAKRDAELAEQRRVAAERQAELDRIAAAEKAKADAEAAAQAERDRIAQEQAAAEAERQRREADQAHRAAVNNAALAALVAAAGLTDVQAKQAVIAIAGGKVPAVTINY